ncbi:MAG: HAD family phosphatase [Oscillospiraceae bacterium]
MTDFKAAIFDLDGTLIDSNGVWAEIDRKFLAKRGFFPPKTELEKLATMSYDEVSEYFFNNFGIKMTNEQIACECDEFAEIEYAENIELKPFAREYLVYLNENGVKIALATASSENLYLPILKKYRIFELFDAIVTTKEACKDKNFPDIYLLAAKKLGINPKDCAVFEDILPAILSAKSAGMVTIGIYDEFSDINKGKIKESCNFFINNYTELFELN